MTNFKQINKLVLLKFTQHIQAQYQTKQVLKHDQIHQQCTKKIKFVEEISKANNESSNKWNWIKISK